MTSEEQKQLIEEQIQLHKSRLASLIKEEKEIRCRMRDIQNNITEADDLICKYEDELFNIYIDLGRISIADECFEYGSLNRYDVVFLSSSIKIKYDLSRCLFGARPGFTTPHTHCTKNADGFTREELCKIIVETYLSFTSSDKKIRKERYGDIYIIGLELDSDGVYKPILR